VTRVSAAEREVCARSAIADPCAAFIDRVGFALLGETLDDLGFDLDTALASGAVLCVSQRRSGPKGVRVAGSRYIPAAWLPPRSGGGGIMAEGAAR
jgi:hypothetical protein